MRLKPASKSMHIYLALNSEFLERVVNCIVRLPILSQSLFNMVIVTFASVEEMRKCEGL